MALQVSISLGLCFLSLVAMPFITSSFLFLVVMPGATSSFLLLVAGMLVQVGARISLQQGPDAVIPSSPKTKNNNKNGKPQVLLCTLLRIVQPSSQSRRLKISTCHIQLICHGHAAG